MDVGPFCLVPSVLLLVVPFWLILSYIETFRSRSKLIRKHECHPPLAYPQRGPLGLSEIRESTKAFHARTFLEWTCSQYKLHGNTFASSYLRQTIIHTIEPKNIKAVLGTNFHHYGIGWRKKYAFKPLFGNSLFQLDGRAWDRSRAALKAAFNHARVTEFAATEEEVDPFLDKLRTESTTQPLLDLAPYFIRLAANWLHRSFEASRTVRATRTTMGRKKGFWKR